MTKHTSEPWVADACRDARGYITLRMADGTPEGDTATCMGSIYHEPNAERIVQCVNALAGLEPSAVPGLVAALERCIGHIERLCKHAKRTSTERDLYTVEARSALAAARGEVADA